MESRHTGVDDRGSAAPRSPMAKGSESASLTDSTSKESDMPKKDKVRGWSKKDVSRWLEKRNLVKFAPLFLKHGVVGSDIVESKLSFLYTDDVMVDDRERILAEIYMLLHPDSPKLMLRPTPSLSLRSIHPKDREKYEAALQVAKSPPSRTVSPPVVFIGSRSRSPGSLTSTKTLTVPATKPRSRSESGLDVTDSSSLTPPSPGRKYLKRKSTPAVHDYLQRGTIQNASLFDTLQAEGQVCLHCVKVQRSEVGSKFGFCYQSLPDCCLLVTKVGSSSVPLQVGDRILEVDGILLPGHKGSTVESVLSKAASLDVVVVRPVSRLPEGTGQPNIEQTKLQQEVVMSEVRWQSLRQLLTSLQHKSFDPLSLTGTLTNMEDMEDTKKRVTLEMEVDELQRNCAELTSKTSELRATLRAKEEELLEVRGQRDRAVDTLRTRFMEHCGPQQPHASGSKRPQQPAAPITAVESSEDLHTLFFEHIEVNLATMERSDASKEDVLDVLRELTKATQRHAQFVDRLISFVSERAPWMIEELNALQEESEQPPDTGPPDANSDANANVNSNANVKPDLDRSGPPRVPVSRGQFDEEHAIIV